MLFNGLGISVKFWEFVPHWPNLKQFTYIIQKNSTKLARNNDLQFLIIVMYFFLLLKRLNTDAIIDGLNSLDGLSNIKCYVLSLTNNQIWELTEKIELNSYNIQICIVVFKVKMWNTITKSGL